MNEEEKEAIEILRSFEPDDLVECAIYLQALEKITNLIDKQQKEIEILKLDLEEMTKSNNHKKENWIPKIILNSYISKEKIKEKIEEITSYAYTSAEERDCQDYAIQVLKELIGE